MDINGLNRILIVDDDEGEILNLSTAFKNNFNFEVLTHVYEQSSGVQQKFKDIRIVFFDLNITQTQIIHSDKEGDWKPNSKAFNELAVAISEVIDDTNQPYALIFWTKNQEHVEAFKAFVYERMPGKIPSPTHIGCLAKEVFDSSQDKKELITETLKGTIFYELMNFEKILHDEVESLMFHILDIANEDKMFIWNDSYDSNIRNFLRTIASKHAGFNHSKENPTKSLTEVLLPLLNDRVIKNAEGTKIWDDILDFGSANKKDCQFSDNNNVPKLNSVFHIDENPNKFETRGAVFKVNDPKAFFESKLGIKKPASIISNTLTEFPRESRDKVTFTLMEISSACDYSQKKERFHKYILGLKLPKECYDLYVDGLQTTYKTQSQSTLDIRASFFDEKSGEYFNIILNKNYVLTLNICEKGANELTHLFTFKKEMMDYIGNQYANHVSRIGITSF